jgi:hypothetical protein
VRVRVRGRVRGGRGWRGVAEERLRAEDEREVLQVGGVVERDLVQLGGDKEALR